MSKQRSQPPRFAVVPGGGAGEKPSSQASARPTFGLAPAASKGLRPEIRRLIEALAKDIIAREDSAQSRLRKADKGQSA